MSNEVHVLKVAKKELLPKSTYVYRTDDGTFFYWEIDSSDKLYIKWEGKEIEADLPDDSINRLVVCGEYVYFSTAEAIYKVSLTPFGPIVLRARKRYDREEAEDCPLWSRTVDGKFYVHNIWDNPETDGILIDKSHEQLKGLELRGLCRGMPIYHSLTSTYHPIARKFGKNSIVIETPNDDGVGVFDSSALIYVISGNLIHALDPNTMEFLQPIQIEGVTKVGYLAGIRNGEMTVTRKMKRGKIFIVTAELPKEHVIIAKYSMEAQVKKNVEDHVKEPEAAITQMECKKEKKSIWQRLFI